MKSTYKKPEADTKTDAKKRKCLMCGTKFQSAWVGERICGKCKSTNAWRNG